MTHGFCDFFFVVTQFNESRGRKICFPGNLCSDGIVSLQERIRSFSLGRCLQLVGFSRAPVLSIKKINLNLFFFFFCGAIFRFFAGHFGPNSGKKTHKLELEIKINCRCISLSLFIL